VQVRDAVVMFLDEVDGVAAAPSRRLSALRREPVERTQMRARSKTGMTR
jgi:hypothetical protein